MSMANEIVAACRKGDLEKVKNLVEQQDVNPEDPKWKDAEYGKTPLHWASHYGHLEVMKYLVEFRKCDPKCKDDKWGNTPLHWAARFGTLEAVKYLVEDFNCDVNCKNNQKNTPLHDAALGGNLEVVRFLIKEKTECDPGVPGRWGRTPLHYACEVSSIDVVKFLLEESGYNKSLCKDDTGLTPLHIAASQGSLSIVQYLIEEQNCEMECKDHHNETPLHEAIKGGRFDVMKYLIGKGCDPMRGGKSGGTALHHACKHGRIEEVKYLIANDNLAIDSQCDNSGASPLHVAAVNGRLDVVKLLVETFLCKLDVQDSNGQTPLELAREKKENEIVSYLQNMDENSGNLRSTLLKQLRPKTKQAIPTGKELGSGAYGSVIELKCEGKIVAGKIFRTMSADDTITVQESIKDELNVMMKVAHTNIVQTMGVCFLPNEPLPVLVMERMEYNLHSYILDPNHFSLPIQTKLSILCDIANGLVHLHNHRPPIIHRDLTANNVLLDSELRAKITDFGNSRILSSRSIILGTFTSLQRSQEYNPFEGYEECNPSLDVFQFGHLALFTTIQTPVRPLLPPNYTDKTTGELRARSEVERRQLFVTEAEKLLSSDHSLVKLIKQCLHNNPEEIPCTGKLLARLQEMKTPGGKIQASSSSTPADNGSHYQEGPVVSIRGADNVGEVALKVIPGEPLDYYWEGHGLRLHIPADALDASTPPMTMKIQASLSGQFELPDDMELVSGVYWISFPEKFREQSITLELQHCAHLEQTEQTRLSFVTSKCNQETLPYKFKLLPEGVFSASSDYGSVKVDKFSGMAVAKKKKKRTQSHSREQKGDADDESAKQSDERNYVALTYYIPARSTRTTWDMHFIIIQNLELCLKTLEKYYPKEEAESSLRKPVVFEREIVTLVIPEDGIKLSSGWSIVPMTHPASLTQSEVDSYRNSIPPTCHLQLHLQRKEQPYERLSHHIKVIGIRGISSIRITRDIDPDPETRVSDKRAVSPHPSPVVLSRPTLPELLRFIHADNKRINIAKEIGDEYKCFGTLLLEDDNGQKVTSMESKHRSDPSRINTQILQEWLNGEGKQPIAWTTLVEVIHDTGLSTLANDISTVKCPTFK